MSNFLNDLPQNLRQIAEKGNLRTPEEVINTPQTTIQHLTSSTEHDVKLLKEAAAKIIGHSLTPVLSLYQSNWMSKFKRLSFGCPSLDKCTRGGLVSRGINEICGASGVGKTQLLLQLSLMVQIPTELGGFGKAVAYICTEDVFPSKRLFQMSKAFSKRYPSLDINYMGNIYIEHVLESEDLLKCVIDRLKHLMASTGIGLIVIDSVAAVFRTYSDYVGRAKDMRKLANALLEFVDKYECVVVCVNQVAAISNSDQEVPCLGLAWAHLGRTRIRVSKVPKQIKCNDQLLTVRKLEIMYSPDTPNESAEFLINENGVEDLPEKIFKKKF